MVYEICIILKAEEGTHRAMLWDAALRTEGKRRSVSLPIPSFANSLKSLANDKESDLVLWLLEGPLSIGVLHSMRSEGSCAL